jgi:alpha-N-arabinofuranosidase
MCLTDGEKLVLTPTYHVFDMYQHHHDARAVRIEIESPTIAFARDQERAQIPAVNGSASIGGGTITISLTNAHATLPQEVELNITELRDATVGVLTHADITAHNTFEAPNLVQPVERALDLKHSRLTLPPASVSVIRAPATARFP